MMAVDTLAYVQPGTDTETLAEKIQAYRHAIIPIWLVCTDEGGGVLYDRELGPSTPLVTGRANKDANPFAPARVEAVNLGDGVPACVLHSFTHGHPQGLSPHVTDAWREGDLLWSHRCCD